MSACETTGGTRETGRPSVTDPAIGAALAQTAEWPTRLIGKTTAFTRKSMETGILFTCQRNKA